MMKYRAGLFWLLSIGSLVSGSGMLPGPPCEVAAQTCFEHATCSTEIRACVCEEFFVMSGDWTKCLPVAAIPYDSACEENTQCSARMGQGSSCLSGKCACKDGFHYLQGMCHKSSGYGEPCIVDNDCYGAFSYESLSCVEQKCDCSEGYYLVGRSYCRRMGNVGEECVFDMDCQFEAGHCESNICVNTAEGSQNVLSFVGNSVSNYSTEITTESPKIELGDACELHEECTAAIENSECFANFCVCTPGYSNFDGSCKPDLGGTCSETGDIDYISRAECRGNILRCKAPYIITQDNRECRIGRLYGLQCQVPEQCRFSGEHAICTAVGNRNLCQCAAGHRFVDEIQLCSPIKGIGEECEYPYDCVVTSGNVHCVANTCTCLEGFHVTRGDCTPDVKALGDPCLDTTDCTNAIPYSSCISSKCQCSSGYFEDPTADNVCVTVATTHGDDCQEDVQCHETLGQDGGACIDGACACKEDYHFRSDFCREKRVLGEVCEQNSQCYLESKELDRVECRNGICQCGYSYTQTQNLDCSSGVGNHSPFFEFIIGALMWALLRETKWK
ncbi:tenascin-like [Cryptotermes secundus]|uniref:tenascin-like n=1 Tax=Cryptotermes secundus TaxID=105785 RepID=UPI001454D4B8|nr:tenascin-like [Cryptotermes secundus]